MIENGYRMEVMDLEEIRSGDRVCHECTYIFLLIYYLAFYDMKESLFKDCMEILVKDGKVFVFVSFDLSLGTVYYQGVNSIFVKYYICFFSNTQLNILFHCVPI